MVRQFARASLLLFLLAACAARAEDLEIGRADELLAALQSADFEHAARLFHYPETYTAAELANDQRSVAADLRNLIREIGNIESLERCARQSGVFVDFSLSGGDDPYWQSHAALNKSNDIAYCAHVSHDGDVFLVVSVLRLEHSWDVRKFTFQLPASAASAHRITELARKVFAKPALGKNA